MAAMPTDDTHNEPADQVPASTTRTVSAPWRWVLLVLAGVSLATGVVGIFVPGLPTTVFLLIAAWAAARSSPRLHRWLLEHRVFGRLIRDWQAGGLVRRRAKWNATAAMAICAALLMWAGTRWWVTALACSCMAVVLCWLWLRPEPAVR